MIDAFIAHLNAAGLGIPVKHAFTSEPVEDYSEDLPVIMVYPLADAFGENGADNFVIQGQSRQVACLIGCTVETLEANTVALRNAAAGWVPGEPWDAMELSSGSTEGIRGGYIWWREIFTIQKSFRQTT